MFVDRTPIKPGQTLDAVASGDHYCETNPQCPDRAYLREHDVYTTTKTSVRLSRISNLPGSRAAEQLHSVTVVLLDTAGHRIGESAWQLDFRLPKIGTI